MAVLSKLAGFAGTLKGKAILAILAIAIVAWLKRSKRGGRKENPAGSLP
jgi:hypothetical protein